VENTTSNDSPMNNEETVSSPAAAVQAPNDAAPVVADANLANGGDAGSSDAQANVDAAQAIDAGIAPSAEVPQGDASQTAAGIDGETAPVEARASTPASAEREAAPATTKQPSMAQVMEMDEFSAYMSGVDSLQRGALLRGIVVRVDENTGEALVDIGTKSEGIVARNEMGDEVAVGDEIEVVVLRPEDDEGHPVLSKRRADYEKTWRAIQQAKDKDVNLEGIVREQVKGGLIVDLGVPAFVPASHVDARNRGDLSRFVGRTIPVRVIEIDRKRDKVIASHRIASAEDREKREAEIWGKLQKDEVVEGIVRRITDFGAFVDIGGLDGLLHVREMAWGRVDHPENVVKKGQKIQVMILDIDEERKRVALGLKQLQSDPWKTAAKNFAPGQMLKGKIARIAPTCAFVELEGGIEGIIPIGEMSETRINVPEDVLEIGQEVEARVKQIQSGQRRITLSLRAPSERDERGGGDRDRDRGPRPNRSEGGRSGGGEGRSSGGGGGEGRSSEPREPRVNIREVNERATGGDGGGVSLGDLFGQQLRAARDSARDRRDRTTADARKDAKARALQAAAEEEEDDIDIDYDAEIETDAGDDTDENEA
jgi:predicted RNA-binding protein with RPS1 domain